MNFHTARLTLRPMTADDAGLIFAIMGDPEAMRFWDRPALTRLAVAEEIVREQIEAMQAGKHLYWTACLGDVSIGSCDLSEIADAQAELGFLFRRDHWGHGYAREAAAAVIGHAFGALGLARLSARIHAGNARAARLLTALAFEPVAILRDHELPGSTRRDCEIYRRKRI